MNTTFELYDLNLFWVLLVPRSKSKFIIVKVIYAQMDLLCGLILLYLLITSFLFCRKEEKKKKSQSGERPVKDERILNLQKKIEEKIMERKKQAGLLKITPQKTRIASRKVWELHKEKSSPAVLLLTDLCPTASTGRGCRGRWCHTWLAIAMPCFLRRHDFSKPWPWPHFLVTYSATTEQGSSIWHRASHSHPIKTASYPLSWTLLFLSFLCHTSHYTKPGCSPPLSPEACPSLSFPWFYLTFPQPGPTTSDGSTNKACSWFLLDVFPWPVSKDSGEELLLKTYLKKAFPKLRWLSELRFWTPA